MTYCDGNRQNCQFLLKFTLIWQFLAVFSLFLAVWTGSNMKVRC